MLRGEIAISKCENKIPPSSAQIWGAGLAYRRGQGKTRPKTIEKKVRKKQLGGIDSTAAAAAAVPVTFPKLVAVVNFSSDVLRLVYSKTNLRRAKLQYSDQDRRLPKNRTKTII